MGGGWGEATETGFEGARWWAGSAVEIRAGRLSYHAKLQYSPAAALAIQGGSTFWFRKDYGLTGNYVGNWFWSRQYSLQHWDMAPGFALRPGVSHVERFYASYFMSTGCVWATAANACRIHSNRTQGPSALIQFRLSRKMRFDYGYSVVHFCDQSNENEPSVPRTCHFKPTVYAGIEIEIHGHRTETTE